MKFQSESPHLHQGPLVASGTPILPRERTKSHMSQAVIKISGRLLNQEEIFKPYCRGNRTSEINPHLLLLNSKYSRAIINNVTIKLAVMMNKGIDIKNKPLGMP